MKVKTGVVRNEAGAGGRQKGFASLGDREDCACGNGEPRKGSSSREKAIMQSLKEQKR